MKMLVLASIACCMVSVCHGQTDTIYTVDNQQIACNFSEIATPKVNYTLPGEELIRSIAVDQIHKLNKTVDIKVR